MRVRFPTRVGKRDLHELIGTFATNGTSDPAAASTFCAEGVTIKYSATGKYTLTFSRYYAAQYGVRVQLRMATPGGNYANVDSVTLNSSGKLVVVIGTYSNSDGAAAIAADAQSWISFSIWTQE